MRVHQLLYGVSASINHLASRGLAPFERHIPQALLL